LSNNLTMWIAGCILYNQRGAHWIRTYLGLQIWF
jgi:hypothetical protein